MKDRGFVYVATGSGYLEEARRSAASLRQHHPDLPICLVTDHPVAAAAPFTDIVIRTDVEHRPIDKLLALAAPYARCVFLDTDTCVLGDLTPLFGVLDGFELAAHQDVNRGWDYELPGVPLAFSEFNTGVIAFRNEPAVHAFFREWRRHYDELLRDLKLVNDQPSFRRAIFQSRLRLAPLPSEFHFLGNFPNSALWQVRLIHARGDYDRIAREANETLGGRAYIPNVGVVPAYAGRRAWWSATWRLFWRMLRLVIRPPTDAAAIHPRKWWLGEDPSKKP
jgi:hypothetical protein